MPGPDLDDVADRLYANAPQDFTSARDAAAKRAPDRAQRAAIMALRRPTASAWVLNCLARRQAGLLSQLLDLGPALAEAQRAGQGEALRTLGRQRRELVAVVTAAAVDLADRPVSAQVCAEIEQTLEAALADPAAAEAVRSGRLVRPLSYAGFGDVDVDGAVASAGPQRVTGSPSRPPQDGADLAAAERRTLDAAAALDDAVSSCERLTEAAERAEPAQRAADGRAQAALEEREHLEGALARARQAHDAARCDADEAAQRGEAAARAAEQSRREVTAAQDAAQKARAELDRLRRR